MFKYLLNRLSCHNPSKKEREIEREKETARSILFSKIQYYYYYYYYFFVNSCVMSISLRIGNVEEKKFTTTQCGQSKCRTVEKSKLIDKRADIYTKY